MSPGPVDTLAAVGRALRGIAASFLFAALFVGVFWTPGLLLALFSLAFAADTRTFSQAVERERRQAVITEQARALRGGWIDSLATPE
jgi:hypothetical protein